MLKVSWYCGRYYGPPVWHGTETFEPEECGTEFETEVDEDDWDTESAEAVCPKCGSVLEQADDLPELVG